MFPYPPEPNIDKSAWGDGLWQNEPDAVSWVDGRSGLNCAMMRHPLFGSWLGYVAVEPGHPLHSKSYRDRIPIPSELLDREVMIDRDFGVIEALLNAFEPDDGTASLAILLPAHGSITYSEIDTDDFWWFGFDCCHADDWAPGLMTGTRLREVYRDHDYVYGITTRLAFVLDEFRTFMATNQKTEGGTNA